MASKAKYKNRDTSRDYAEEVSVPLEIKRNLQI